MKYLLKLILLTTTLLPTGLVWAFSHTVTPPVIEYNSVPRDMMTDEIKVSNEGGVMIKIFPSVHVITLGEEGNIKTFESPVMTDQTTNPASWISLSHAPIELAAGESIKIPINITINPYAKPGDYYAFIGFGAGDKRDEAEQMVVAGRAPGVTVRISIDDKTNEYLRLQSFNIDRYVLSSKEKKVSFSLENVGATAVVPRGEIIFYDVKGHEVGNLAVNSDNVSIEPKETKIFEMPLPETGVFGRHKAFLNLEYGQKKRANLYDTTFFTIIPWKFLITIFAFLLFVTFILTLLYLRRNYRKKQEDDESIAMYVRSGIHSDIKDHDINLKQN